MGKCSIANSGIGSSLESLTQEGKDCFGADGRTEQLGAQLQVACSQTLI